MNRRGATILAYAIALLLCLYFLRPTFNWFNGKGGANDWDAQTFYLEAAIRPVLDHGRRPVWNPWYGGGLPQAANPQVKLYSPTWIFALATGSLAGHKIALIFYYLLGTWSMMFLLRSVLRLRALAALCGTVLYVFAGSIPLRVVAGHTNFFCILLYPLVVAFFIRSVRARGGASILYGSSAAITLSFMYSEGAHAVMLFLPGAGFALAAYAIHERRFRIFARGALVLFLFGVLSAHRLVPQVEYMLGPGANVFPDRGWISPEGIRAIFLDAVSEPTARKWVGQKYLWWEYGTYIGWTSVVLMPVLLPFMRRRLLPLAAALFFLLLLTAGHFADFAPARLLGFLPFYGNLRGWGRFAMPALLCWSVLYAVLLHGFLVFAHARGDAGSRRRFILRVFARSAAVVVLLWSFYDLRIINARHLRGVFALEIPAGPRESTLTTIHRLPSYGAASSMLPALHGNLSTRDAYEMLRSNRTAAARGEQNYRGEFHLQSSGRAISPTRRYADRIEFDFVSARADTLLFNMNYAPGWRGATMREINGLLAAQVSAGRNRFAVQYDDAPVKLLLILSGVLHTLFLGGLGVHALRRRFSALSEKSGLRTSDTGARS